MSDTTSPTPAPVQSSVEDRLTALEEIVNADPRLQQTKERLRVQKKQAAAKQVAADKDAQIAALQAKLAAQATVKP